MTNPVSCIQRELHSAPPGGREDRTRSACPMESQTLTLLLTTNLTAAVVCHINPERLLQIIAQIEHEIIILDQ